jgi:hypothetical protein
MAVDDQVMLSLPGCHHDDRCLLARGRQGDQQLSLPFRMARPQMPPPLFQLMEFQLHRLPSPCCFPV